MVSKMRHVQLPIKLLSLIGVLLGMLLLGLTSGSVHIPAGDILSSLWSPEYTVTKAILMDIRIPRLIIAAFVGANLAASGGLLQSVMRNPLADPGITGVSAGASLCAITIMLLFPAYVHMVPLAAFMGGALACAFVYALAWKNGIQPLRIVLAGVALNAVLGGATGLLSILNSDKIQGVLLWTNGSIARASWQDVSVLVPYSLVGLVLALFLIRPANILLLGDDAAQNLGFNVNRTRIIISAVAVLLAGASVAAVGIIGFVGLVVPHICRLLFGSDYKKLLPTSMLLGAATLVGADTLARTIAAPVELPVGTMMAMLGGPFFLYLLRKGERM